MDKIILKPDQLKELESFIRKRGFTDAVVVNEILDHFACKVEEKLTSHPEMEFHKAMEKAHSDFGIKGFAEIASNFENALKTKYRNIYRAKIIRMLRSPVYLLAAGMIAFGFYRAYFWANEKGYHHVLGTNDVETGLFLIVIALYVVQSRVFGGRLKNYYMSTASKIMYGWAGFWFAILTPNIPATFEWTLAGAVVIAFFAVYFFFSFVAGFKTLIVADKDFEEYKSVME